MSTGEQRYGDLKLKLACRHCKSSGLIALKELHRILYCSNCQISYRVEPTGLVEVPTSRETRISVQVRTNSSEWRTHRAIIPAKALFRERVRDAAVGFASAGYARWVALGVVTMLLGWTVIAGARSGEAPPAPPELPTTLEDRAAAIHESAGSTGHRPDHRADRSEPTSGNADLAVTRR